MLCWKQVGREKSRVSARRAGRADLRPGVLEKLEYNKA